MFTRKNNLLVLLIFNFTSICFAQTEFITTWTVTPGDLEITIPTNGTSNIYNVVWGDGNSDIGTTGDASHTYSSDGTYTVTITGTFNRIYFNADATNAPKIQSIEQWGSTRAWTSMNRAFDGCTNLVINDSNAPILTSVTTCQRMFRNASSLGNGSTNFNLWDVSNVTNMSQMFRGASVFNEDLNSWITNSVTNMSNLFRDASNFNGNISSWNTGMVNNMTRMFQGAGNFNQNIGGVSWNTQMVTTMSFMFLNATNFNQNINDWDVSAVNNMDEMFRNATAFNQNLNSWNVSSVTNMNEMFRGATSFNGNISSWVPSSVIIMSSMFRDATTFNQNINGWGVGAVTNMSNMFYGATSFNQNINGWTVSAVTNMANMFRGATSFNQSISGWNVSSVDSMAGMFREATSFNQDISGWTTTSLTNLGSMFRDNGNAFDQNIGSWDVSNVTNFNNMFNGSKLSVANYNALLIGWNAQILQSGENLHAGSSRYCSTAAIAAKTNMENPGGDNWSFTDGGVLTSFVWTGTTDTDWNDNTNWQDGFDNDCTLDVTIPSVTNHPIIDASSEFTVDNLTIDAGASLTIEGGLTVTADLTTNNSLIVNSGGSIIVNGLSTGNLTYNRILVNAEEWYYIGVPLENETIEDYIANNNLATGNSNVGLFYYDNNTTSGFAGSGFIFYQPASTGSFVAARGYGTQIDASGDITFTGTMPVNDVSIAISEGTMGDINPNSDNLIGNPYPSYIAANLNAAANPNNLLNNNSSILSEQTLWLWDNTLNDYRARNQGSAAFYIAPGQGFFVNSTSSGGTFNFLESWQSHQTTDVFFKDNSEEPFRIKLTIENHTNLKRLTEVYYISEKTVFFDNGYDSSKLNENENLDFYTRLVGDTESQNLAIQSLPNKNLENMIIPLGIKANGNILLSLATVNKPNGISIYLEDKKENTLTKLSETSKIELDLSDESNEVGRFYLHTKSKTLHIDKEITNKLTLYTADKELVIVGDFHQNNNLVIYNLLGKQTFRKKNVKSNRVALKNLRKGVYFVQFKTPDLVINKKIVIK